MISYKNSLNILRKSQLKIGDEIINSSNCLNRISASNIFSKVDNPAANNAAFDGFAINYKDTQNLNKKNSKQFRILGSIAAGNKPFNKNVKKFDTIEVMTGGIISKPFNTIIPIEKIDFYPSKQNPKFIIIDRKVSKYNHIRFKGSDYKVGQLILKKGTIIRPNHILALKTLGIKINKNTILLVIPLLLFLLYK